MNSEYRQSRNLNRHMRNDVVRRLWKLYVMFPLLGVWIAGLFLLPVNDKEARQMLEHLLDIRAANVAMVPLNLSIVAPLFGLLAALLVSQVEKPVYRAYAMLPMSRAERGRRIWFRQAIAAPGLVLATPVVLVGLTLILDTAPIRAFMFLAVLRVCLLGLTLPALILLFGRRPVSDMPGVVVFSLCIGLIAVLSVGHYVLAAKFTGPIAVVWWIALAATSALVLGLSRARARQLAVNALEPAARRPRREAPNTPQSLRRLIVMHALAIPRVYAVLILLAFVASLFYPRHDADRAFHFAAMDAMLAGMLVFSVFQAAGRFVSEQARLLRALPLSPGRIAAAALAYAVAGSVLLIPLAVIVQHMLVSGRSPMMMAGAIFFAADAGCLAAVAHVRFSRWASQVNVVLSAGASMILLSLSFQIHDAPLIVQPDLTRAALAALPFCLLLGFFGMRSAIRRGGAYVYRDIFLEKFAVK